MNELKLIGSRVKQIRKDLGLLQDDFAKKLSVSVPTLSDVENGKTKPGFDILYGLVTIFNVNLDFILLGENPMFKNKKRTLPDSGEEKIPDEFDSDEEEILWFMKKSKLFRGFITSQAKEYLYKNEAFIARDIQLTRSGDSLKTEIEKKATRAGEEKKEN